MLGGTKYKHRERLVSPTNAKLTAVRLHRREVVSGSFMNSPRWRWVRAYELQLSCSSPTLPLGRHVAKPPYPPYARGSRFLGYEPKRYMAAIRLHFFDVLSGTTDRGL